MKIILHKKVVKAVQKINEPYKCKISQALDFLAHEPPRGDIKPLESQKGYRIRIGPYRLLFEKREDHIFVYNIGTRGQIYKGGE